MSLTSKEEAAISKFLIPEQVADQSLENLSILIRQHLYKSDRFKLCRLLMFLLEYEFLCNKISQFTTLYLIWDMSKLEHSPVNLFTEFIVSYLQNESLCKLPQSVIKVFHSFLSQSEESKKYLKFSPSQLFDLSVPSNEVLNWSSISSSNTACARLSDLALSAISYVIPDEDTTTSYDFDFHPYKSNSTISPSTVVIQRQCVDSVLSQDDSIVCRSSLQPEFIRIAAPYLPCQQGRHQVDVVKGQVRDDNEELLFGESASGAEVSPDTNIDCGWLEELIWLNPHTVIHDFHWNASTDQNNLTAELRQLILTVTTSALTQSQQQTVVQAIKDNPNLVHNLGISPELLPSLVDRNPVIAIDVLQLLITSPKRDEYFSALLSMDVSVQSLEVVNRLTTKVELPADFIRDYIFKCLSSCYVAQDKFHQMRHVRLVCVLLQSLIRNNILDLQDQNILVEVRTFCLEFTRVREATILFRLVSNLKTNSSSAGNESANPKNTGESSSTANVH